MKTHLKAMERHLPYGIIQCYLPPNTGECAMPQSKPDKLGFTVSTQERRKAVELTWCWLYSVPKWLTCPQTVIHLSSNQLIAIRPEYKPMTR